MLGCKYEKIEIVNHLLRAGADVNKIDDFEGLIMEKDSQNISQGFIRVQIFLVDQNQAAFSNSIPVS
jgi:hypothetical protein